MRSQRGATLVEMLVAMAMPALAAGGVHHAPRGAVAPATDSVEQVIAQALASRADCAVSTIATPATVQPLAVYASPFSFSFVSECSATQTGPRDQLASYSGGDDLPVQWASWHGGTTVLPAGENVRSTTDTITFFFQPDQTTARTDDFVLMRQLNTQRPELVVRNVLTFPGQPFFRYYYRTSERQETHQVPSSWLPLWHLRMDHGMVADTGTAARIDMLRAIEMNYSVSNGRTGADERIQSVNKIIPLSSLVSKHTRPCGYDPFFSQASYSRSDVDVDQLLGSVESESRPARSRPQTQCSLM